MAYPPLLQAALNGDRVHPATPHSPEEIAAEAKAAVAAGAQSVHLHPYGDGRQTLDAGVCAETIRRVRQACPRTTISPTTSADVVEDPAERLRLIAAWTVLPDLVTANQGEEGILEVCELLLSRGVGIEAWLLSLDDAHQFVAAGVAARCVRAMVEPLDADPADAVAHAEAIENTLHEAGVALEKCTTATASRRGRSTSARCTAAMASGPGSRTPQSCPTAGKLRGTAT